MLRNLAEVALLDQKSHYKTAELSDAGLDMSNSCLQLKMKSIYSTYFAM